eukprot:13926215-Alexandrium_andersonii.AAC.1
MAESPRGQGRTPSMEAHWGPFRAAPNKHLSMGESALTERLGAPLRGAPSCCVKASSPIVRCPFGGGSEGGP